MTVGDELEERARRGTVRGADEVWASGPVQAALARKKAPVWVLPVLLVIPLWALLYLGGLSTASDGQPTPLERGAAVYDASCARCHGGDGGGGVGRPLADGDVLATFPDIADQLTFVHQGSAGTGPQGTPYGDPSRPGGQHAVQGYGSALMPPFGDALTGEELLAVVRYEREVLSGEVVDPAQLDPDGDRLWPDGSPMLDASGRLVGPDGRPLFDGG